MESYAFLCNAKHENFATRDSGLWLHEDFPYLGATPDALVRCSCCGCAVVEVKVSGYYVVLIVLSEETSNFFSVLILNCTVAIVVHGSFVF